MTGPWKQTYSGRQFFPLDPKPEDIDILDIAKALSRICRYGGHLDFHYSVAQHCVLVARDLEERGLDRQTQFAGLLHDAAEAYLGDVCGTFKDLPQFEGYRELEYCLERTIEHRYGLPYGWLNHPEVKRSDARLLATEYRYLVPNSQDPWGLKEPPTDWRTIVPQTAEKAEASFLTTFGRLL